MDSTHIPVLLKTACDYLDIKKDNFYVDTTVGGGGHTLEILKRGGRVLGLDQDIEAINYCTDKLSEFINTGRLTLVKSNFEHLKEIIDQSGETKISGILFDLGISMSQITRPERGFSFQKDGPLDMRMDLGLAVNAQTLIDQLTVKQLSNLLSEFGEFTNANTIASKIKKAAPHTTGELAGLFSSKQTVRRVFQALRIAVNDELGGLERSLDPALSVLESRGRLVIISFHSLEDRLVKNFFKKSQLEKLGKVITPRPVIPAASELKANPASHSAKLRVFEKK